MVNVFFKKQKTLNTNKCTKSFFVNYNTLLHVSTLLGHPQGETSVVVTLGCTIQLSENVLLTVHCAGYEGVNYFSRQTVKQVCLQGYINLAKDRPLC
jgi:hypothetical protein